MSRLTSSPLTLLLTCSWIIAGSGGKRKLRARVCVCVCEREREREKERKKERKRGRKREKGRKRGRKRDRQRERKRDRQRERKRERKRDRQKERACACFFVLSSSCSRLWVLSWFMVCVGTLPAPRRLLLWTVSSCSDTGRVQVELQLTSFRGIQTLMKFDTFYYL